MSPSGTQNGTDEGPRPKSQRPSCLLHHWPWDQLWLVGLQEAMLPFTECFSFGVLAYPWIKSEILGKFSLPPGPSIPQTYPATHLPPWEQSFSRCLNIEEPCWGHGSSPFSNQPWINTCCWLETRGEMTKHTVTALGVVLILGYQQEGAGSSAACC